MSEPIHLEFLGPITAMCLLEYGTILAYDLIRGWHLRSSSTMNYA